MNQKNHMNIQAENRLSSNILTIILNAKRQKYFYKVLKGRWDSLFYTHARGILELAKNSPTEGHEPFKKRVGDHNPQTLQRTPTERGTERKAPTIPLELLIKEQDV